MPNLTRSEAGAAQPGLRPLRAAAAAALTICALACGNGQNSPAEQTPKPSPPVASPPTSIAEQMARAARGAEPSAPRRDIDWSLIKRDPWVTKLGRFDQVVEADSVCLGSSVVERTRCVELRRMLDKTVNEAQVRATVGAAQRAWPALTRVWTAAFKGEGRTFEIPKMGYYGWHGDGIPGVRADHPDCPPTFDNAFYCKTTREIFYDAVFLTRISVAVGGEIRTSGEHAAVAVIAHELGHAVEAQTGAGGDVLYRKELLADCFSGAAMAEVSRAEAGPSKATQVVRATTPLAEGQLAMYLAGGPRRVGDHESGPIRADYFTRGFNLGAANCNLSVANMGKKP